MKFYTKHKLGAKTESVIRKCHVDHYLSRSDQALLVHTQKEKDFLEGYLLIIGTKRKIILVQDAKPHHKSFNSVVRIEFEDIS